MTRAAAQIVPNNGRFPAEHVRAYFVRTKGEAWTSRWLDLCDWVEPDCVVIARHDVVRFAEVGRALAALERLPFLPQVTVCIVRRDPE